MSKKKKRNNNKPANVQTIQPVVEDKAGKIEVSGVDDVLAYKQFLANFGRQDFSDEEKEAIMSDNPDPEVIDKAFDKMINVQLTDVQVQEIQDAVEKEAATHPDIALMRDIEKKVESGELDSVGEFANATVNIDPVTSERQIVAMNEDMEEPSSSLDDLIQNTDIEISDTSIQSAIKSEYDFTDYEMFELVNVIMGYKKGQISLSDAWNKFPDEIKSQFDLEVVKAGIPLNNIKSYRNRFMKDFMNEILLTAQSEQMSIDLDKQISNIYKEYGNDVSLLYQSSFYDRIKSVEEKIKDEESKEEINQDKINNLKDILESLHESYQMNKFGTYAIKQKIKPFEMEKPKKLYNDFRIKYNNSKFMIQDVANIIPVLIKYLGFSEDQANQFAILFCKYTKAMRADSLADHSFMYYFIANIISINTMGGVIEGENTPESYFARILIDNINAIMYERANRMKDQEITFVGKKIDEAHIDQIIELAAEKAKQMEEEAKKFDEENEGSEEPEDDEISEN